MELLLRNLGNQFNKSVQQPLLKMTILETFKHADCFLMDAILNTNNLHQTMKQPSRYVVQQQCWLYACQLRMCFFFFLGGGRKCAYRCVILLRCLFMLLRALLSFEVLLFSALICLSVSMCNVDFSGVTSLRAVQIHMRNKHEKHVSKVRLKHFNYGNQNCLLS